MVNGEQTLVGATARRVRPTMTSSPNWTIVAKVTCDQCGEQFQITHRMSAQDEALAQRQARWLADRFVWDHIQENKHRSSIDLPSSADMK
jgi:hypothetical protein